MHNFIPGWFHQFRESIHVLRFRARYNTAQSNTNENGHVAGEKSFIRSWKMVMVAVVVSFSLFFFALKNAFIK